MYMYDMPAEDIPGTLEYALRHKLLDKIWEFREAAQNRRNEARERSWAIRLKLAGTTLPLKKIRRAFEWKRG